MISVVALLAALAAAQPPAPERLRCLGVVVPVSGLRAAYLDDAAVTALRRFARAELAEDYRTRYVVYAPYGFDRGTTSNQVATQLRGETVRAHLIGAGLPENRIRVLHLGEHADYRFPAELTEARRIVRQRAGNRPTWTTAASVTVELPPGAAANCSRSRRP